MHPERVQGFLAPFQGAGLGDWINPGVARVARSPRATLLARLRRARALYGAQENAKLFLRSPLQDFLDFLRTFVQRVATKSAARSTHFLTALVVFDPAGPT